jgi:trans-aconitate methyltransferase
MQLGEVQKWDAQAYAGNARFVADLGADILGWLAPQKGERILDLGCGDGALTVKIAASGADVLGVDASAELLDAARTLGLKVQEMDGQALSFGAEFDAVFSNAALHWMKDAPAVVRGVHRALKSGGRFVAEFGGHGNVAAIVTALRAVARRHGADEEMVAPWFYPTPQEYGSLLEQNGFAVKRIALVPRPTPLPTGMAGWLRTFRAPFFDLFGDKAGDVVGEVEELLAPALRDKAGNWTADYVRLKVFAVKE